jgi:hypothetical protein
LGSGNHVITIKDGDGCEKAYTINVTQPTAGTATMSSYVTGSNGSVTVTSSGGTWNKIYRLYNDTTSPYTVGGGTLVATITGVTSGNPSQTFSNLVEGYYYVVVTDANGCPVGTSPIQSTFAGKSGPDENEIGDGDLIIESCFDSVEYLIDSTQLCDGTLSLNPTTFQIGDYVQFTPNPNCDSFTTYCGLIVRTESGTPTAILTSSDAMNGCNDLGCME